MTDGHHEGYHETSGQLYPPLSSAGEPATLCGSHGHYFVRTELREAPVTILKVEPSVGRVPQRLSFDDGQIFIPDQVMTDAWIVRKSGLGVGFVNVISKLTPWRIGVMLSACLGLFLMVSAALPFIADGVATTLPMEVDRALGRHIQRAVELQIHSSETQLSEARISKIEAEYGRLLDASTLWPYVPISFQRSPVLKANALALPGGPVIILDDLVTGLEEDRLIAAVLAHEVAHIEMRHGMRQLARATTIAVVAYVLIGPELLFSEEVTSVLIGAVLSSYSRDFESEADLRAAELLEAVGRNRRDLVDALHTLGDLCGESCQEEDWFSTHPPIDARILSLQN